MKPLMPGDAVLCSDGGNGYKNLAAAGGIEHFVVGSKPGTRVTRRLLSHPECLLSPRPLQQVHQAFLWSGDEESQRRHGVVGGSVGGGQPAEVVRAS